MKKIFMLTVSGLLLSCGRGGINHLNVNHQCEWERQQAPYIYYHVKSQACFYYLP